MFKNHRPNCQFFFPGLQLNTNAGLRDTQDLGTAEKGPPFVDFQSNGFVSTLNQGSSSNVNWTHQTGRIISRAPGAETKFRKQQLPVVMQEPDLTTEGYNFPMYDTGSTFLWSKLNREAVAKTQSSPFSIPPPIGAMTGQSFATSNGRSAALEHFRAQQQQQQRNFQLCDIAGHIVEFSQDPHGSRFIQNKLESATQSEKQSVFNEIIESAQYLMTDVYGNYVIQKLFDYGLPEHRPMLVYQMQGNVLNFSQHMYGCRVIQKALERTPIEQQRKIIKELKEDVLTCAKDQNANHVIQKCFECVDVEELQFIIDGIDGKAFDLSTHPYGCRVVQRILEHCPPKQIISIRKEILVNLAYMVKDQYGNYVIQHVLEHAPREDKSTVIQYVMGKILTLSQHKFASNVVEKCVIKATKNERSIIIKEVCMFNDLGLQVMMKDQFANYVVQKMIDLAEPSLKEDLLSKIRVHVNALRKYAYGKHIIAKLQKVSLQ
jgi:pumilio RNA-binding family